jgi:two-component system response regulator DegU
MYSPSAQTRVLVVDNQSFFRCAVQHALADSPDITVVAQASTHNALQAAEAHSPDVALCGVNGSSSALDLMAPKRLHETLPNLSLVVLTSHVDDDQLYRVAHAGAAAYLEKDSIFTDLARVIRQVAAGWLPISETIQAHPFVTARILDCLRTSPHLAPLDAAQAVLSAREKEVLSYVALGCSNKEIGHSLGISEQTVKNHLAAIFRKLDLDDRTQAALYAIKQGMVSIGSRAVSQPEEPALNLSEPTVPTYYAY